MKKLLLVLLIGLISFNLVSAETVDLPVFGELEVSEMPLVLATILIATADGFNPCSIWVLLFLLGMIIHTGSRKRIALIGGTFLLVTATIYGIFIAGIITIFSFMSYIDWLIYLVVTIALIFGLVNVKDYFWYKKGISFTIPDKYKPKFFKKVRELIKKESIFALIGGTVLMAAGIAIVELPCTAGLPLVWSGIVTESGVTSFYAYLLLYIFMYLLIEIIILISVLVTLKSFKMDEFKGRALKLVGGILIIALALVLLFDRSIMYNITGVLAVMMGSIVLSITIILLDKLVFKRK